MQISTRFSIAVHMLLCTEALSKKCKTTSELMAASAGVNPVVIRRLASQLKKHGLLAVAPGTGGASLGRPAAQISLYDVYQAVESVSNARLFSMHERPNQVCPIGRGIETLLHGYMQEAQLALENSLKKTSIADLAAQINSSACAS